MMNWLNRLREGIIGLILLTPFVLPFVVVVWLEGWLYALGSYAVLAALLWLLSPILDEEPNTPGNAFQATRRARYEHNRRA